MLDLVAVLFWGSLKVCGWALLAYLLYFKVIDYAYSVWFYGR